MIYFYQGYAAVTVFNISGGGSNYSCVTDSSLLGNVNSDLQGYSPLVGVEYEGGDAPTVFSTVNNGGQSLGNLSPPCIVCYVSTRNAQIMIPGTTACPAGWTEEAGGYLVSIKATQAYYRSSFICLVDAPETVSGSGDNNLKAGEFWVVEAECSSSLTCPPYVNGNEIACVICTI